MDNLQNDSVKSVNETDIVVPAKKSELTTKDYDTIQVGNISASSGIAIGRSAQATVTRHNYDRVQSDNDTSIIGPGVELSEVDLSGIDLSNVNLSGTKFFYVGLLAANLCGTNFSDAEFFGVNVRRARYNKDTKWPEGFDPQAAGAIKVD